MCGILCSILYSSENNKRQDSELLQRLKNRGPDCISSVVLNVTNEISVWFHGAVLWTQGPNITKQPVQHPQGVLVFNGDIYNQSWDKNESDTNVLLKYLVACASSDTEIIKILKKLKGPFCLIYLDKVTNKIYFARDRLGRGSLLLHKSKKEILISSVLGRNYQCIEIPATHIYILNVNKNIITSVGWNDTDHKEYSIEEWLQNIEYVQNLSDSSRHVITHIEPLILEKADDIIQYIEYVAETVSCKLSILDKLLEHHQILETVKTITQLLEDSVKIRLEMQPKKCKNCIDNTIECSHSAVGVLFSGGLDCTVLAYLANKYVKEDQSIDLINVAFKNSCDSSFDVPDRLTGKQSYEELKEICHSRKWIFREVNVLKEDLEECQRSIIADLIYPRKTILDESLGSALWYAAQGKDECDVSSCRIILLGSGADELFGGYVRHRNAYRRRGWDGLNEELILDWNRISFRNLARDNRVICDHGRVPRMPYLDDDFTEYVLKLKPWFKCFPSENLGVGIGEKLMLRLVAYYIGLKHAVTLPKRALQFGSRIANKKENGSDLSKNLVNI